MANTRAYEVNESAKKDSSFKSFICALLVFLAICGIFGTIFHFVGRGRKNEEDPISQGITEKLNGDYTTKIISILQPTSPNTKEKEDVTLPTPKFDKATVKERTKGNEAQQVTTEEFLDDHENITKFNINKKHEAVQEAIHINTDATTTQDVSSLEKDSETSATTLTTLSEHTTEEGLNITETAKNFTDNFSLTTTFPATETTPGFTESSNVTKETNQQSSTAAVTGLHNNTILELTTKVRELTEATKPITTDPTTHRIMVVVKEKGRTTQVTFSSHVTTKVNNHFGNFTTQSVPNDDKITEIPVPEDTFPTLDAPLFHSNEEVTTEESFEILSEVGRLMIGQETEETTETSTRQIQTSSSDAVAEESVSGSSTLITNKTKVPETPTESDKSTTFMENTSTQKQIFTDSALNVHNNNTTITNTFMQAKLEETITEAMQLTDALALVTDYKAPTTLSPPPLSNISTTKLNITTKNYLEHTTPITIIEESMATLSSRNLLVQNDQTNSINVVTTKNPIAAKTVCSSAICQKTASAMLNLMNPEADPCEDFYEFACGSVQQVEDLVEKEKHEKLFSFLATIDSGSAKYFRDFKTFFTSCIHHEDVLSYSYRLKSILALNITELVAEMILEQSMPFFDVGIDFTSNSRYILQLTLPGLSSLRNEVEDWNLLSRIKKQCLEGLTANVESPPINLSNIYVEYKQCQYKNLEVKVKNFMNEVEYHIHTKLSVTAEEVLRLFREILSVMPSKYDLRQSYVNKEYHEKTVEEINNYFSPLLNWRQLFFHLHNIVVKDSDVVQVYFLNYLEEMVKIFKKMDSKKVADELRVIHLLNLYENTVVSKGNINKNLYCMDLATQLMPDVASNIYKLSNDFHTHDLQNIRISQLFQSLKKQLSISLSYSTLDSNTVEVFQKKLKNVTLSLISRSDMQLFQNMSEFNYQDVNLSEVEFIPNVLTMLRHYRSTVYSLIRTTLPLSSTMWGYFVSPFSDTPIAFYPNGFIAVPPGVFKPSLRTLPSYMELIQAGLPIARELSRQFDPVGRKYSKNFGNIDSSDKYYHYLVSNMQVLMTSTSAHREVDGKNISYQINGRLSTTERILDNTALRLIFDAFASNKSSILLPWVTEKYTIEKIFFIAAAQRYCKKTSIVEFMQRVYETETLPGILKVENIVSNSENFSKAFECGTGSGMNPEMIKLQFPFVEKDSNEYEYDELYNFSN